jgi:Flp pilus assembly protein TadG
MEAEMGTLVAAVYFAIDVTGQWPTKADLRDIAARAAKSLTRLDISDQEIYEYLSRVALGPQRLDEMSSQGEPP